jgi:hypothetical protein
MIVGAVAVLTITGVGNGYAQLTPSPGPSSTVTVPESAAAPTDPCSVPTSAATTTPTPTLPPETGASQPCETLPATPEAASTSTVQVPTATSEVAPTVPEPTSTAKEPWIQWTPTEDPKETVIPGQMRSDRQEIPNGVSKEEADLAETMEARQRNNVARAAPGCQSYWPIAFEVCGVIRDKYNSLGGPNSFLNYPASNELVNPDNIGRRSLFVGGIIYWSPNTGAHPMNALFLAKWAGMGYEAGFMGYPTSDEIVNPDGFGRRQSFERGGWFYYSQLTGVQQIGGAIYEEWGLRGYEGGELGYPISDEIDVPTFLAPAGTRMNIFQRIAVLIYNPTTASTKPGRWFTGTGEGSGEGPAGDAPEGGSLQRQDGPGEIQIEPGLPVTVPCPGNSQSANTGSQFQAYQCVEAFPDPFGEVVPLRAGRIGDVNWDGAQTAGGFGEIHAFNDHNIDADAIGKIINVATPVNIGRRIEHFATFKVDDNPYIRAFVSTTKGVSLDANDGQAVGVITAFCKTGSEAGMGLCPDFINNTLGSAVGPS